MTTREPTLSCHDRAVLPRRGRPFFLYQATSPVIDSRDCEQVTRAVGEHLQPSSLGPGEIEAWNARLVANAAGPATAECLTRLASAMGLSLQNDPMTVLACEQAFIHEDSSFAGNAFVSLVLHTGPMPYVVDMLRMVKRRDEPGYRVKRRSVRLSVGDLFVMDPTIAHGATPLRPRDGQLLVLLQAELPLESREDHLEVLRRYPRHVLGRHVEFLK